MSHLAGALFEKMAAVKLVHVPYRGSAQSVVDLMESRIELLFGTIAPLNREVVAILAAPEMREALDKQGVEIDPGSPEALAARIREDVKKWRDVIASAGIGAQ